jgi:hypothetical protein
MNLPSKFAQNYPQLTIKKQRHPTAPNLHSARPYGDLLPPLIVRLRVSARVSPRYDASSRRSACISKAYGSHPPTSPLVPSLFVQFSCGLQRRVSPVGGEPDASIHCPCHLGRVTILACLAQLPPCCIG